MPTPQPKTIRTDALVIGTGPVGLYQAFQLGLLGLDAHIVDAQSSIGGQCSALYADKPLYDIPALLACSGAELVQKLHAQLAQIVAFAPLEKRMHLNQLVAQITAQADGRYHITTNKCQVFDAACIIIAAGVGAFVPRTLNLAGLDAVAGSLHHAPTALHDLAGHDVVIVGDDDAAVHWACTVAESATARSVTLSHRRAQLSASSAAQDKMQALITQGCLQFRPGVLQALEQTDSKLHAISLMQGDGTTFNLPCTQLFILLGLSPKLGPIADWGLDMQRKHIVVNTAQFATSARGIFAVGDINTYPGKQKLIACGFHEATLAAHAALAYCYPDKVGPLQYTTSSALLQSRLGKV